MKGSVHKWRNFFHREGFILNFGLIPNMWNFDSTLMWHFLTSAIWNYKLRFEIHRRLKMSFYHDQWGRDLKVENLKSTGVLAIKIVKNWLWYLGRLKH